MYSTRHSVASPGTVRKFPFGYLFWTLSMMMVSASPACQKTKCCPWIQITVSVDLTQVEILHSSKRNVILHCNPVSYQGTASAASTCCPAPVLRLVLRTHTSDASILSKPCSTVSIATCTERGRKVSKKLIPLIFSVLSTGCVASLV